MDEIFCRAAHLEQAYLESKRIRKRLQQDEQPDQARIGDPMLLIMHIRVKLWSLHTLGDRYSLRTGGSQNPLRREYSLLTEMFFAIAKQISSSPNGMSGKLLLQAAGIWNKAIAPGNSHARHEATAEQLDLMRGEMNLATSRVNSLNILLEVVQASPDLYSFPDRGVVYQQVEEIQAVLRVLLALQSSGSASTSTPGVTATEQVLGDGQPKPFSDLDQSGQLACIACLETGPCFRLNCHEHGYCPDCLRQLFEANFKDSTSVFPPKCCQVSIPLELLAGLATNAVMAKYQNRVKERSTKRPIYCASCSTFIRTENVDEVAKQAWCWRCRLQLCECGGHIHTGKPCADDAETEEFLQLAKKKGWQRCRCGAVVSKNGGCNHMQCSVCSYSFCYMCGKGPFKACRCQQFDRERVIDGAIIGVDGIPRLPQPGEAGPDIDAFRQRVRMRMQLNPINQADAEGAAQNRDEQVNEVIEARRRLLVARHQQNLALRQLEAQQLRLTQEEQAALRRREVGAQDQRPGRNLQGLMTAAEAPQLERARLWMDMPARRPGHRILDPVPAEVPPENAFVGPRLIHTPDDRLPRPWGSIANDRDQPLHRPQASVAAAHQLGQRQEVLNGVSDARAQVQTGAGLEAQDVPPMDPALRQLFGTPGDTNAAERLDDWPDLPRPVPDALPVVGNQEFPRFPRRRGRQPIANHRRAAGSHVPPPGLHREWAVPEPAQRPLQFHSPAGIHAPWPLFPPAQRVQQDPPLGAEVIDLTTDQASPPRRRQERTPIVIPDDDENEAPAPTISSVIRSHSQQQGGGLHARLRNLEQRTEQPEQSPVNRTRAQESRPGPGPEPIVDWHAHLFQLETRYGLRPAVTLAQNAPVPGPRPQDDDSDEGTLHFWTASTTQRDDETERRVARRVQALSDMQRTRERAANETNGNTINAAGNSTPSAVVTQEMPIGTSAANSARHHIPPVQPSLTRQAEQAVDADRPVQRLFPPQFSDHTRRTRAQERLGNWLEGLQTNSIVNTHPPITATGGEPPQDQVSQWVHGLQARDPINHTGVQVPPDQQADLPQSLFAAAGARWFRGLQEAQNLNNNLIGVQSAPVQASEAPQSIFAAAGRAERDHRIAARARRANVQGEVPAALNQANHGHGHPVLPASRPRSAARSPATPLRRGRIVLRPSNVATPSESQAQLDILRRTLVHLQPPTPPGQISDQGAYLANISHRLDRARIQANAINAQLSAMQAEPGTVRPRIDAAPTNEELRATLDQAMDIDS